MDTSEQTTFETVKQIEKATAIARREAPNRRRDLGAWRISGTSSATARGQCQPGFGAKSIVKEGWVKVGPAISYL